MSYQLSYRPKNNSGPVSYLSAHWTLKHEIPTYAGMTQKPPLSGGELNLSEIKVSDGYAGFTLLELSIVLTIITLIVAGTMAGGSQMMETTRLVQTNNKLDTIEQALMAFHAANNRLPCPANATIPADSTIPSIAVTYGAESANLGSCVDGTLQANFSDNVTPTYKNIVEGAVPFKALNLPEDFMYDGWGRKFAYAVNATLTGTKAMQGENLNDPGKIVVNDAAGKSRTTDRLFESVTPTYRPGGAIYVLVSFGSDGHGGFLKSGARMSSGSTDNDEQTNCHCDAGANPLAPVAATYSATYVQKEKTPTFDNIVRYKERWQMATYDDISNPHTGAVTDLGFAIPGTGGAAIGNAVAIGDVNGDGIPDLIIGAPGANGGQGYVYVIFGSKYGFPNPLPLNKLDGTNGFRLDGSASPTPVAGIGSALAVGDVNGDGVADLVIGLPYYSSGAGAAYVVYGGKGPQSGGNWPASQALTTNWLNGGANAVNGFMLTGTAAGQVGYSVAAGDVNGDGVADIVLGAPASDNAFVIYGGPTWKDGVTPWQAPQLLNTGPSTSSNLINGVNGVEFDGDGGDINLGWKVAAGDINADGIGDIILSDKAANHNGAASGSVFVVYGRPYNYIWPASQTVLTTTWLCNCTYSASPVSSAALGFRLDGVNPGDQLGASLTVGDVNGDGITDLAIGEFDTIGSTAAGSAYIIFGGHSPPGSGSWPVNQALTTGWLGNSTSYAVNGFRLDGTAVGYNTASALATADINSDGIADIIIGANNASNNSRFSSGSTYVIFGGPTRKDATQWAPSQSLTVGAGGLINGANPVVNGFRIDGLVTGDASGSAVAAGDINGDGTSDLVIGAIGVTSGTGAVYVGYGRPSVATWPAITDFSAFK